MLSEMALGLIREIFERPDLFRDLPRIGRRVVAWGPGTKSVALPHAAVVVSERFLLESLWSGLSISPHPAAEKPDVTVFSSRPLPPEVQQHRFGTRAASAAEVRLRNGDDGGSCWIESLEHGWLFLIPSPEANWLLAVGGRPETLLESSRLIAPRIELLDRRSGEFSTCPQIAVPLGGGLTGWLAVRLRLPSIRFAATAQPRRSARPSWRPPLSVQERGTTTLVRQLRITVRD